MTRGAYTRSLPVAAGLTFILAVGCAPAVSQSSPARSTNAGAEEISQPQTAPVATQEGQVDNRPGVAVWPFSKGVTFGSDPWDYGALEVGLQQMLITELAQNSELRLVNRSHLREIIDELDLGQTGYVTPETKAEVGRLVQARYIIFATFNDFDGTARLDARIDNVETSEILTETAVALEDDRENLLRMVVQLGVRIVERANLPRLPRQVVEERMSVDLSGEGAMLFSQAVLQESLGNRDEAVRLLNRVVTEFPDYKEAREMLEQVRGEHP